MSFILDALKKSELERQRQASPGFIEAPLPHRRGGLPVWVWVIGAVLLANVGVLSVLLWRSQRTPVIASTQAPARRAAATAAPPAVSGTVNRPPERDAGGAEAADSQHFSPLDASPVYAPEIPVDNPPRSPAPDVRTTVPPLVGGAPRARRSDPTLNEAAQDKSENEEVLPTINEVNLQGDPALQDMHLDVHVYASRPAERFVYINMRKYHEGATLQEGAVLEHIRRDGVVLNYRGVRFLLPRQ